VLGSIYGDSLTGNSGANLLEGAAGNDTLSGGGGADTLAGGVGDDTYVVNAAVSITEGADEGTDTVVASVTHTLATNVENLTLAGGAAINGTGNGLDNLIVGNSANNALSGGIGNDTLQGGSGNDTLTGASGSDSLDGGLGADSMAGGVADDIYEVDNVGDVVTELAGQGTGDLVKAWISHTLAAEVENLVLLGVAAINGTGMRWATISWATPRGTYSLAVRATTRSMAAAGPISLPAGWRTTAIS
jgi:Ca2+-binding RTX toxin-like protein